MNADSRNLQRTRYNQENVALSFQKRYFILIFEL